MIVNQKRALAGADVGLSDGSRPVLRFLIPQLGPEKPKCCRSRYKTGILTREYAGEIRQVSTTRRNQLKTTGISTALLGVAPTSGTESGAGAPPYRIALERTASVNLASLATRFDAKLDIGTTSRLAVADRSERIVQALANRSDPRCVEADGGVHTLEVEPEGTIDRDGPDTAARDGHARSQSCGRHPGRASHCFAHRDGLQTAPLVFTPTCL